jgi:flagellin-specific chaperone FliS
MLMFFGIINFMESNMTQTELLEKLLVAQTSLCKIQNIIDSSDTHLTSGGLELDEEELTTIYEHICQGLGDMNVQD